MSGHPLLDGIRSLVQTHMDYLRSSGFEQGRGHLRGVESALEAFFTDIFQIAIVNEMGILSRTKDDDEMAAAGRLLRFMVVLRPKDSLFTP